MNFVTSFLVFLAVIFFASVIYALYWAVKTGQFQKMEQGAKTIFTAEEPEGQQTDFFPTSRKNKKDKKPLTHV